MSERNLYSILRDIPPGEARSLLDEAAKAFPGTRPWVSKWSDRCPKVLSQEFEVVAGAGALVLYHRAWLFAREMARISGAPHLELRVQEGDHWDFTLCKDDAIVADFSTRVSYYNADESAPRPWKQGDGWKFAEVWGVPYERVEPYLIDWDGVPNRVRESAEDRFTVNDWCQIFDFMRAIDVEDPHEDPNRFIYSVPTWQDTYRLQPIWRRIIRRGSVWWKGTYPDLPPLTPEQLRERRERRASIRIYRSGGA